MKESEEKFKHERSVRKHELKELSKYFYKKDKGVASSSGTVSTKKWNKEASGDKKVISHLSSQEPGIKIENEQYVILTGRIKVMKSGKQVLERHQSQLKEKKAGLKQTLIKVKVERSIEKVESCLETCRELFAKVNECDATVEQEILKKITETVNSQIATMVTHSDAIKTLLKSF